jgi:hypothetical protein
MAQAHTAHGADKYYIPHGSKWPSVGAAALYQPWQASVLPTRDSARGATRPCARVAYMFRWFGTVIARARRLTTRVDRRSAWG